jgi:hypothetical protein
VQFGLEEIGIIEVEFETVVCLKTQLVFLFEDLIVNVGVIIKDLVDDGIAGFGSGIESILYSQGRALAFLC